MSKVRKAAILFAIAATVCAFPLSAQFVQQKASPTEFASNSLQATAGLFGTDMDDYMDYHGWSGINLNNWFGFVAMGQAKGVRAIDLYEPDSHWKQEADKDGTSPIYKVSLGYARKFGSIYVAGWYSGNIVEVAGDRGTLGKDQFKTETLTGIFDQYTQTQTGERRLTVWNESFRNATNQIEFLIGVQGHGIRVGYFHSAATDRREQPRDLTVTTTFNTNMVTHDGVTDEFAQSYSIIGPYLGWGSTFAIGEGMAVKPYVTAVLGFYTDKVTDVWQEPYTVHFGNRIGSAETTNIDGYSRGYIRPWFGVGASLDLPQKGAASMTAGIDYGLGIFLYSNNYDGSGFGGDVAGTAWWSGTNTVTLSNASMIRTEAKSEIETVEKTLADHTITPSFSVTTTIEDNLRLGAKLWLPVTITAGSDKGIDYKHSVTTDRYDNPAMSQNNRTTTEVTTTPDKLEETTTFAIAPKIGIGASYALVPGRFTVNAGVTLVPLNFTREVVKTTSAGIETTRTTVKDGNNVTINDSTAASITDTDSTVAHTDTWAPFAGNVSAGFALSLGASITLDFLAGVDFGGVTGAHNFDFDLTRLNVLFTFQF